MTKKKSSRKPNIPSDALERARRELYGGEAAVVETTTADAPAKKKKTDNNYVITSRKHTMTIDELKSEYGYVITDLRSMAILAAVLFIGMIVVSLIMVN